MCCTTETHGAHRTADCALYGLQVCLELLIAVALRNRDRIVLIWPLVHEYLNAIMTPNGAKAAHPLVARVSLPSALPSVPLEPLPFVLLLLNHHCLLCCSA